MPPSRTPHKKSRSGCNTCKQRRIKVRYRPFSSGFGLRTHQSPRCPITRLVQQTTIPSVADCSQCDEAKPTCQQCLGRGRQCTYGRPHSVEVSSLRGWTTSGTAVDRPIAPQSGLPDGHHGLRDQRPNPEAPRLHELYLMHNYSTVTFGTLANLDSPEEVELWRTAIPREAMKYGFLMDGLLALSSLHLACLEPSTRQARIETAVQYQNSGLYDFKTALDDVTEANSNALFAFSIILILLALATPGVSPEPSLTPSESLMSIFKLLQGVGTLRSMASETLHASMFNILLRPLGGRFGGPRVDPEIVCADRLQATLAQLRDRADHLAKYVGRGKHRVYISSIQSLETSFRQIAMHQNVGVVIAWPVKVDDEIMNLLHQEDPMAQVIWVHYGVLLLHVHSRWWAKDFGVRLINNLSESVHSVDAEWAAFTQIARDCAIAAQQRTS